MDSKYDSADHSTRRAFTSPPAFAAQHRLRRTTVTMMFTLVGMTSSPVFAETLMETFELALQNDASWAAQVAKYRGDKESVKQAYSSLLPQANFTAGYAKQKYKGSALNTQNAFNQDDLARCEQFTQAANRLGPGQTLSDINNAATTIGGCTALFTQLANIDSTDSTQTYSATRYGVNVVQPLFRMDRWYTYKQAKKVQNSQQAQLAYEQQNLMIRVAEAYFGILKAQEELRLALEEEKIAKGQLEEIKNRYTLGLMRDTDLFEAQSSVDRARAARIRAEGETDNLKESLRAMTQQSTVLVNPLPDNIAITPAEPADAAQWEQFAMQHNYRVVAARYAVDSAHHQRRSKKSGHLPTVDLYADYSHSDVGGGFTPSSDTASVGINMSLPLYSGGFTSSQSKQANYQVTEAKSNLRAAQRSAATEAKQFHRRIATDVAAVTANQRAIKSSNSAFESIRAGYTEGVRTMSDLINARRRVFAARKDFITSRYDYVLNTLRLKRAAGLLALSDLDVLNSSLQNTQLAPTAAPANLLEEQGIDEPEPQKSSIFMAPPSTEGYDPEPQREGAKSLFEAIENWRKGL